MAAFSTMEAVMKLMRLNPAQVFLVKCIAYVETERLKSMKDVRRFVYKAYYWPNTTLFLPRSTVG
jgi:hypothetical protein